MPSREWQVTMLHTTAVKSARQYSKPALAASAPHNSTTSSPQRTTPKGPACWSDEKAAAAPRWHACGPRSELQRAASSRASWRSAAAAGGDMTAGVVLQRSCAGTQGEATSAAAGPACYIQLELSEPKGIMRLVQKKLL